MPSHHTMFHRLCFILWIMRCSKPSLYYFLPVIPVQVDVNFSHPKNVFGEGVCIFLHLVMNPLYLLSWSLLLIVDFDSDVSISWRLFFTWLDVVKGFFVDMERILRSSTTVVLRGRKVDCMMWVHSNNFQMQMESLESVCALQAHIII